MRVCVYPGTFDPFTTAHLDILKRACSLFDHVHVCVLTNVRKKPIFTVDERIRFIEASANASGISNFTACSFGGLLVDFAAKVGACASVRGLRNVSDFESESAMSRLNQQLAPELETVLLVSKPEYQSISSSAVCEIGRFGGSLNGLVHNTVIKEISERLVQI